MRLSECTSLPLLSGRYKQLNNESTKREREKEILSHSNDLSSCLNIGSIEYHDISGSNQEEKELSIIRFFVDLFGKTKTEKKRFSLLQ